MSKEKIAAILAAPIIRNGKVDWNATLHLVKEAVPDFDGSKKKLQDMQRTKSMQRLIAAAKEKAAKKAAETSATTEASAETVTEIERAKNKDGSYSATVDLLTARDAVNMSESDILRTLGYDPTMFKVVSSSCRKGTWQSLAKNGDENEVVDLCSYRLTANVKPLTVGELNEEFIRKTLEGMLDKPIIHVTPMVPKKSDKIAILSIADLHLGKLAWGPEVGESYDHKIATRRFNFIVNSAIDRLQKEDGIEKIIFYWSQDFFHFDNIEVTTTAGTRQDTDVRWQKMFQIGIKLLQEAITKLEKIAPVYTFRIRSNHDTQIGFFANEAIGAFFHDDPNVEVDTSPTPRKYIHYGVNLFGFGHGDKEGKRISSLMPIEQAKAWGVTTNHEFFLGHFHSLRVYEEGGVILRYLSSPTGTDAWHCESGFLGAQKAAQLFIRGKFEGQIADYTINVE